MKYRLNKAEKVPFTLHNVARTKTVNGKAIVTYSNYIRLIPGEEYRSDDEAMLNWFRNYRQRIPYTKEAEAALKNAGVSYETEMCRSCGGRVKKIIYQLVEVFDE